MSTPSYETPEVLALHRDAMGRGEREAVDRFAENFLLTSHRSVFSAVHPEMPMGVHDHFKGGIYLVTGVSESTSEGREGELVVEYLSLIFGKKYSRFGREWQSIVRWPDGEFRSRYIYRGPNLDTPAPSFKVPTPTVPR